MFHSIISILTTASVALHAILGCCAHHDHSCCKSTEPAVEVHEHAQCCHGHTHRHNHQHGGGADCETNTGNANSKAPQPENGPSHQCDDEDCSFTIPQRTGDLSLMLAFSACCQIPGDAASTGALNRPDLSGPTAETPPDPLSDSGTARALAQVWRL